MVQRIIILIALVWGVNADAVLTVVTRESFQNIGTLDTNTPGNLGTFLSGSWQKRAIGPRVTAISSPGFSGDAQALASVNEPESYWDLATIGGGAAQLKGVGGCWVRFADFTTCGYFTSAAVANPAMILRLDTSAAFSYTHAVGVTAAGQIVTQNNSGWVTAANFSPHTWYWVQIAWTYVANTVTATSSYQPLGGALTALSTNSFTAAGFAPSRLRVMDRAFNPIVSQHFVWRGRLGNATLSSIGAMSDAVIPSDDIAPVEARNSWFLNPSTGNDTNTGISSGTAWLTVEKFNAESLNSGFFSSSAFSTGDILNIDTSGSPLDIGTNRMQLVTLGLTIQPISGQDYAIIKPWKDVSSASTAWTQYNAGSFPNIWASTDGSSVDIGDGTDGAVVIWENEKWLSHPIGASITAVRTNLNTTPGSFWADNSTLYLVPNGNTNPNSDGKTYKRSRCRVGVGSLVGADAVYVTSPAFQITGFDIRKTCLVRGTDNLPYEGYGIKVDGTLSSNGVSRIANCYVSHASKHGIGRVDSSSAHTVTWDSDEVEQCSPYASNSPFVDYNGNSNAVSNVSLWLNCTNIYPSGTAGTIIPATPQSIGSYLSHNNGVGVQYSSVTFNSCMFGGAISLGISMASGFVTNTQALTVGSSVNTTINRSKFTGYVPSTATLGTLLTMRNSLVVAQLAMGGGDVNALAGTNTFENCTFDFRTPISYTDSAYSLMTRSGVLTLNFRNNVVLVPPTSTFNLLRNATNSDTLTFTGNAYFLGTGALTAKNYNGSDRTFSQWQVLGFDAGSLNQDPCLSPNLRPYSKTPAWNIGSELGPLIDYTGKLFQSRRTAGAYEYATDEPRMLMFHR